MWDMGDVVCSVVQCRLSCVHEPLVVEQDRVAGAVGKSSSQRWCQLGSHHGAKDLCGQRALRLGKHICANGSLADTLTLPDGSAGHPSVMCNRDLAGDRARHRGRKRLPSREDRAKDLHLLRLAVVLPPSFSNWTAPQRLIVASWVSRKSSLSLLLREPPLRDGQAFLQLLPRPHVREPDTPLADLGSIGRTAPRNLVDRQTMHEANLCVQTLSLDTIPEHTSPSRTTTRD